MARKKATVIESKRGSIQSWDCSECGWFTHADAEMAEAHVAVHNQESKPEGETAKAVLTEEE